MTVSLLLAIAVAGACGSVCRFLLAEAIAAACGAFPLHTLVVNVLGCVLFGALWAIGHGRWPQTVTLAVLVGFFGAFTTFSSFAFDCVQLVAAGRAFAAAAVFAAHNLLGIAGLWAGIAAGRAFAG